MTATQERARRRDRPRPPPQGGPAADHRPHPLDRQPHAARDAAPRDGAQPVRPRHHHLDRHRGGEGRAQRRRRAHRRRLRRRAGRAASTPGRSPPTRRRRPTRRCRATGSPSPARSSPSWSPAPPPRRATPPSSSTSTTTSCRPRSTSRRLRRPTTTVLAHPDLGTNKSAPLGVRLRRGRHRRRRRGGDREGPRRRHRHRARVPPAAADPGLHGAALGRGRPDRRADARCGRRPRSRTSSGSRSPRRPACRSRRSGSIAPDVGGGFGGKLQATPEEWIAWAVARRLGKPVKYTETRSESLMAAHHGRDQWQKLTLAAEKDGTVTGLKVDLLADLGSYVALVGGGVPVLGAFMFNAIYKFPAYRFTCQTVLTNKTWTDAYRGAGRPEATYAHRADDGRARRRARRRPAGDPREELDQARGVPVHHGGRAGVRLRQLRGRDRARPRRCSATTSCAPSRSSAATPATGSSSASASRRSPRCAASRRRRVLGSLDYGAGGWEHAERADARDRQGRGRHRRQRPRPGPRDGVQPDRRRPARRGRSRTSRCCTATPRSPTRAWTPTARARWWSAARRWCGPPTR